MQFEIAQHVSALMLELSGRLDESVRFVMENADEEEFQRYRRAVGKLMGDIFVGILSPLYAEHPSLTPEGLRPDNPDLDSQTGGRKSV